MILTVQLAGIGLMMAPAPTDLPTDLVALPDMAQTSPAPTTVPDAGTAPATETPPVPVIATPPIIDPAVAPAPETPPAATPAVPTCGHCGPVYATRDPLIGFNRISYKINQPIDRYIFRPPAMLYHAITPKPVRDGVHNVLANVYSPATFVNDVLQLRPKRALNTLGRFLINTTLGLGGIFDIAKRKPFHMQGHTNNFSNTLAMLGVTSGPYIYLPFVGPTSFRDLVGAGGDTFTQPLLVNRVYSSETRTVGHLRPRRVTVLSSTLQLSTFGVVASVLSALDRRSEADPELKALKASSVDPYVALREAYLQNREAEIAALRAKDGEAAPIAAFDDPLADPAAAKTPEPAPPAAPAPAETPTPR